MAYRWYELHVACMSLQYLVEVKNKDKRKIPDDWNRVCRYGSKATHQLSSSSNVVVVVVVVVVSAPSWSPDIGLPM